MDGRQGAFFRAFHFLVNRHVTIQSLRNINWPSLFTIASLCLSLTLNVFLAQRGERQKAIGLTQLDAYRSWRVSSQSFFEVKGDPIGIDWGNGKKKLIYHFDPGCRWCGLNRQAFSTLSSQLIAKGYEAIVFVPEDAALPNAEMFPGPFRVISASRLNLEEIFRFNMTPQTLVLDEGGSGRKLEWRIWRPKPISDSGIVLDLAPTAIR